MAQSLGNAVSATAAATDASGGVGGSDVQLDDAEVGSCHRCTSHMDCVHSAAGVASQPLPTKQCNSAAAKQIREF